MKNSVHDLIQSEWEDRARTLRESGDVGYGDRLGARYTQLPANGPEAAIRDAVMGASGNDYVADNRNATAAPVVHQVPIAVTKIFRSASGSQIVCAPKWVNPFLLPKRVVSEAERPHIYERKYQGKARYAKQEYLARQPLPADALICDIEPDRFINLYSGVAFANRCGCVMNVFVTVTWSDLGLTDEAVFGGAFEEFQDRCRDWFGRQEVKPIWLYSMERSHRAGLHTHWMFSVPHEQLACFKAWITDSLMNRLGDRHTIGKAVDVKPITNLHGQWEVFQYLCKGVRSSARIVPARRSIDGLPIYLGDLIKRSYEPSWDIPGKRRVGMSDSINGAQRRKGFIDDAAMPWSHAPNFRSLLELGETDVRKLYSEIYYEDWKRHSTDLLSRLG